MRESIGTSLLLSLIVTIVGLMIAFLIGSLAYSKAFKAKNKIINIIEKYDGYNEAAEKEINTALGEMGYRVDANSSCPNITVSNEEYSSIKSGGTYDYCVYQISTVGDMEQDDSSEDEYTEQDTEEEDSDGSDDISEDDTQDSEEDPQNEEDDSDGDESTVELNDNSYYRVITYMYFDIPIINKLLKFKVSGETKVIFDTYDD